MKLSVSSALVERSDTLEVTVTAAGGRIFDIAIDYGDRSSEHSGPGGTAAQSAWVRFRHQYTTSGAFTVRATVADILYGSSSATVNVMVR